MDGIIVINKPKNCTSHDVVKKVKKILNEKVGHTGTLDPNATGVLPLLVGKGTQISKYLINHDKVYEAVLKIGEKTDTADAEGKIIETQNVKLSTLKEENIKIVLKSLIGEQKQIPPMYSAIKVNGKKLYEYARSGEIIKVEPRLIYIYNLELIKVANQEITYKVHCSKGTYIRTLCEQIAEKLGTVGYMKELKRLQVGEFKIEDSLTIDEIEKLANIEIENPRGFVYDNSSVWSKRSVLFAHTSYWSARKTFANAVVKAFSNGYRLQYDKEFQQKVLENNKRKIKFEMY